MSYFNSAVNVCRFERIPLNRSELEHKVDAVRPVLGHDKRVVVNSLFFFFFFFFFFLSLSRDMHETPFPLVCHANILPASTEHNNNNNKEKLLHLSHHFTLFSTVSLLFNFRFVARRRGFPRKFASCCLCHNK